MPQGTTRSISPKNLSRRVWRFLPAYSRLAKLVCYIPQSFAIAQRRRYRAGPGEISDSLAGVRDAGNVAAGASRHSDRAASRRGLDARLVHRVTAVIRIDAMWLAAYRGWFDQTMAGDLAGNQLVNWVSAVPEPATLVL